MKEINYTFSIGSNCDSTFFMRYHKLSKFSGPMDWVYVDFDSALKNIEECFDRYTSDLFYYHPSYAYHEMGDNQLRTHLINKKQYKQVDSRLKDISKNEFQLHPNKTYPKDFYINQNFLPDEVTNNLVKWNHSCWFPHHNFNNIAQNHILQNKISAFNHVYANYKDNILFIGFNKFETIEDAYYEIRKITNKYHQSSLGCDVFYIILAPTNSSPEVFKHGDVTFLLKHYEGIYQFDESDKIPEAVNYLKGIYNFNLFDKPNNLDYLPIENNMTTYDDDKLDYIILSY